MALLTAQGGPITTAVHVSDESQIGEARRLAVAMAPEATETVAGRIAIVASELATNLARHARDGVLLLRKVTAPEGHPGMIELAAVDRGPGISDVARSLRDGFSTGGTSGVGLGALSRLADLFDIYSLPGQGTAVVCRIVTAEWSGQQPPPAPRCEIGVVCLPYPGEQVSGDAWAVHTRADGVMTVMLADGLGHGPKAADAGDAAIASFLSTMQRPSTPGDALSTAHLALRATRGAAVAIAELDPVRRTIHFAGVGNIAASLVGVRSQSFVSLNGIVGHQMGRVREFAYEWSPGTTLVFHSDGLTTKWNTDEYPGVLHRHPTMLAALLARDAIRGKDDATVMVVRDIPETEDIAQ